MERLEADLEEWHHFALFLAVDQVMVVLHGYEWGEVVLNSIVWAGSKKIRGPRGLDDNVHILCMAWTGWKKCSEWMSRRSTVLGDLHCQAQQLLIPI